MNMNDLFLAIGASVGGSAVLLAVMGFLARSLLSHLLTKDLETFKANLQMQSQHEMSHLKASLELIAFEHQVRFAKLHEVRAEVIEEIYGKIDDMYNVVSEFIRHYEISDESWNDQKIKNIWGTVDDFRKYFGKHKIYLGVDVCEKVVWFEKELSQSCSTLISFHENRGVIDLKDTTAHKEWIKASSLLDKEVEEVKRVLERSFREILGVITT